MPNTFDSTPAQAVTEGSTAPSPGATEPRHKLRGPRGRFVSTGGPRRRGGQPGNLNSPGAAIAPWRTLSKTSSPTRSIPNDTVGCLGRIALFLDRRCR